MVMMKCGHTDNATSGGKPVCAICIGTVKEAEIPASKDDIPSLEGRKAGCWYCGKLRNSSWDLAFFQYRYGPIYERCKTCNATLEWHKHPTMAPKPAHEFVGSGEFLPDSYYCGCRGWD